MTTTRFCKLSEEKWSEFKKELSLKASQINPNRFFNHQKNNYMNELKVFTESKLERINILKEPEKAKQALADGGVYVFTLLSNNEIVMIKRNQGDGKISHAVVAENRDVICAGEVKMINITVNNKIKPALDISNDSGHYMPNAESLPKVMAAFEKLNLWLYRVTATHPRIPSTFTAVDENLGTININKSRVL